MSSSAANSAAVADTAAAKPAAGATTDSGSGIPKFLFISCCVTIVALWIVCQHVLVPYVANLLILVTTILYVGCHCSLRLREEQALGRGEVPPHVEGEDAPAPPSVPTAETLRQEDAMTFPIVGSASLFSLYLAFKFLDKEIVNVVISVYFCLIGVVAIGFTFAPLLGLLLPKSTRSWKVDKEWKLHHFLPKWLGGESPWEFRLEATAAEILGFVVGLGICGIYVKSKHWALNNVLGICFCLQGIQRFSLGTYKIGAILLVGLFFYDIFWVFGTDVMVTVAKSLDGPIKILFPRSLVPNEETGQLEMSLLGLGDIIIPGFFLALLLRFDAHNAQISSFSKNIYGNFPKPYFLSCLVCYFGGLVTTLVVMIYFNAAQPALLYLVPACLGSSIVCALVRGEVSALLAYSEEEEEEAKEGEEGEKKDGDKKEEEKKVEAKKDK